MTRELAIHNLYNLKINKNNRSSGQFHIFWNTVSAIFSKPFELET